MKAEFFEKRAEAGMGGPNIGTFLDREIARLKNEKNMYRNTNLHRYSEHF